jgi:uncharacterized protein YndB with AHSA1/START domain
MDQNRFRETMNQVGKNSHVEIRLRADHRREIRGEVRIIAAPAAVFALLTDAQHMMNWLARSVTADARPGGLLCLADLSGLRVEGTYLEVVRDRKVVFTWGGIGGLRPGQSTVEFVLHADGNPHVSSPPSFRPLRCGSGGALSWLETLGAAETKGCRGGRGTTRYLLG